MFVERGREREREKEREEEGGGGGNVYLEGYPFPPWTCLSKEGGKEKGKRQERIGSVVYMDPPPHTHTLPHTLILHVWMYICVFIHIYIYVYIHICMHACMYG